MMIDNFVDLLLSAAPVESHVGAVVDSPNAIYASGESRKKYFDIERCSR